MERVGLMHNQGKVLINMLLRHFHKKSSVVLRDPAGNFYPSTTATGLT